MKIINQNPSLTETFVVSETVRRLQEEGTVVMMPVAGVYALVCRWNDKAAKDKIYKLKKSRTFQIFFWDAKDMPNSGLMFSREARKLAVTLCPAWLTIIDTEGAGAAFAIPPEGNFFQKIVEETGSPLAVISAGKDAVTPDNAISKLYGQPDYIVDRGTLPSEGITATIVEISGKSIKIIREGAVSESAIRKVLS